MSFNDVLFTVVKLLIHALPVFSTVAR